MLRRELENKNGWAKEKWRIRSKLYRSKNSKLFPETKAEQGT
jgi:hypothetical protein